MNRVLAMTVAGLVVLASFTLRADEGAASVVGVWLGETRTQGGLGTWIELRSDGSAQLSFGALVDFAYRLEGTSLWITAAGQKEVPAGDVTIEGNTAVRRQSPPADALRRETLSPDERAARDRMSQPLTMRRVGNATPGAPGLVGTWMYTHPTGPTAYETYTPGGKMFLLVPMETTKGLYQLASARIVLMLPTGEQTLVLDGDVLVSSTKEGKRSTFRRAPK